MELLEGRAEHVQSTRVVGREGVQAPDDMERRSMLRAGFGEEQRGIREIERGEPRATGDGRAGGLPVQPARDHQVQHDKVVVLERQDDPFAEAADVADRAPRQIRHGRIRRPQQERACDPEALELCSHDARGEGVEV